MQTEYPSKQPAKKTNSENRKNFGDILASLRKQHHDKYHKEWNTEKLSQASAVDGKGSIPAQVIANIECGRRANIDSDTLLQLAAALSLTPLERKDFFFMAVGVGNEIGAAEYYSDKDSKDVFETLSGICAPAYIMDQYCDFVAFNSAVLNLFGADPAYMDSLRLQPAGLNMLRYIFTDKNFKDSVDPDHWKKVALNNVFFLRRITLKYRHTDYFQQLLDALLEIDDFGKMWFDSFNPRILQESRQNIALTDNNYSVYKLSGQSFIGTDTPVMTSQGELHLVAYIPQCIETADVFMQIVRSSERKIHFAASWPEKEVYWPHVNPKNADK